MRQAAISNHGLLSHPFHVEYLLLFKEKKKERGVFPDRTSHVVTFDTKVHAGRLSSTIKTMQERKELLHQVSGLKGPLALKLSRNKLETKVIPTFCSSRNMVHILRSLS